MKQLWIWIMTLLLPGRMAAGEVKVTPLVGFPDKEKGYEQGVSACFAGCIDGYLVMAGGANFAEKPVAEGGKKCFYKGIYAAKITRGDALHWEMIGELPQAMAYGTTVKVGNSLILIGGQTTEGSTDAVYQLSLKAGKAVIEVLPSLPTPTDNHCATAYKNKVYVAGGASNGRANEDVLMLNLKKPREGWQKSEATLMPSVRNRIGQQAVCFVRKGELMVLGGFSTADEQYPAEVYDGPSGGALVQTNDGRLITAGGVNHEIFLDAISGRYECVAKEDYLKQPVEWYKFDGRLQLYNPATGTFTTITESPHLARAGAALVAYKDMIFSIGGETKPGIRSPQVTRVITKR